MTRSQLQQDCAFSTSNDFTVVDINRSPALHDDLFRNGPEFDFFQAVMLLETIYQDCGKVGDLGLSRPAVKFATNASSSSFAASSIFDIRPATTRNPTAKMVVSFLGLTGPSGILPQHYTELLKRIEFEARGQQKHSLREWFDLFNHRTISLFYKGWKKYRPFANHLQGLTESRPDDFSFALQCLAGIGLPNLTSQVTQFVPALTGDPVDALPDHQSDGDDAKPQTVGRPDFRENLSLLRYAGLLSQRPRSAANLKNLLEDYFQLKIEIQQYFGNWLSLDETAQTRLGIQRGNCTLGVDSVVGDQTWERQNKILIKVGPLTRRQFSQWMPDHNSLEKKNDFQLMKDLVRIFVPAELEFDIQLLVEGNELPVPELSEDLDSGLRLGWNTWLSEQAQEAIASEAIFTETNSW